MLSHVRALLVLLAAAFCACGPQETSCPTGASRCGLGDAGGPNLDGGGSVDSGNADAGSIDAGDNDAGSVDAGSTDAGSIDAGNTDAGKPDAGSTDAGKPDGGGSVDAGPPDAGPACTVTVCLTGAVSQTSSSNDRFTTLCDDPALKGVLQDCDTGTCYSSFDTFPSSNADSVYARLFAALDTNHDLTVNAADSACNLDLLGFSWGGVNAVRLAEKLFADPNVWASRKVNHLILLDAFQTGVSKLVIPQRVEKTYSYRHSVAPSSDCSSSSLMGPYLGIPPRCVAGQACFDYDYSLSPATWFPLPGLAYGYYGADVGHCTVPGMGHLPALANVKDQAFSPLPASVAVQLP